VAFKSVQQFVLMTLGVPQCFSGTYPKFGRDCILSYMKEFILYVYKILDTICTS